MKEKISPISKCGGGLKVIGENELALFYKPLARGGMFVARWTTLRSSPALTPSMEKLGSFEFCTENLKEAADIINSKTSISNCRKKIKKT